MLRSADAERVAELMHETAAAELQPRFRSLTVEEIRQKRPGDLVTVADEASEQRLAAGLAKILPGVPVVGEEAVEKDAGLLDLIARPGESCWVVDPLDGTKNFAAGRDRFAIIVALVHDTRTVAGWILNVPRRQMAVALEGEGVVLDGVRVARRRPRRRSNGFVGYNVLREFRRQLHPDQRRRLGKVSPGSCAGAEYLEMLAGQSDFNLYRRAMPWDHAAGALMMTEVGGVALRIDGLPYGAAQPTVSGVNAAIDADVASSVRDVLDAVRMPLLAGLPKVR